MLDAFQAAFAEGLRTGRPQALAPWLAPGAAVENFSVYRNNFVLGCADRLAAEYPAVTRLVGKKFFQAAARRHIAETPPADPYLALYGAEFPDFLDRFPPAESLLYLADVARIERAWIEAHHAAESPPLRSADLPSDPGAMARLRTGLHGSAAMIASPFPVLTIWRANRSGVSKTRIALDQGGETALLWRPYREVRHAALQPGDAVFIGAVQSGRSFGEAAEAALLRQSDFDLSESFGRWLKTGLFAGAPAPSSKGENP